MAAECANYKDEGVVMITAPAALTNGQVLQMPDGRAAAYNGMRAASSGDYVSMKYKGLAIVAKTATVVFLPGQEVWWKVSTNAATYRAAGDFFVGIATAGAAVTATTLEVDLNAQPQYLVQLGDGQWTSAAALGLGVTEDPEGSGIAKLAFDNTAEIAMAALYGAKTLACAYNPIFEAEVAIYDIGDDAALDITIGIANGTHATDFDSVTESCVFHLDGNALDILAESDDGTTEVAATDTTINAVDDTYFFVQIDARSLADIQLYINGANVLPASVFKLDAATGPLLPIVHIEKTSNDTTADVRVRRMTMRGQVTG